MKSWTRERILGELRRVDRVHDWPTQPVVLRTCGPEFLAALERELGTLEAAREEAGLGALYWFSGNATSSTLA